jgi:hypothetical protein
VLRSACRGEKGIIRRPVSTTRSPNTTARSRSRPQIEPTRTQWYARNRPDRQRVADGRRADARRPGPYAPEPDAKDLKAVLFDWTWHMGMLRGIGEHELIATLEYQGNGTIEANGEPCRLWSYRASANYRTPGQRIRYACMLSIGRTVSDIEVEGRGVLRRQSRGAPKRPERSRPDDARDRNGQRLCGHAHPHELGDITSQIRH